MKNSILLAMYVLFFIATLAHAFPPAPIPQTGQTSCWDASGTAITCAGTGHDGELKNGVVWPNPRFTDNANGTVTDNLTGLIWLKNANCTDTVAGISKSSGYLTWANALTWSNNLASGACGLTDSSSAGQWHLPSVTELQSLLNDQQANFADWLSSQGFSSVQADNYWSGSSYAYNTYNAWYVGMYGGFVYFNDKSVSYYVWPVRSGQ